MAEQIISPGVFTRENDLSFLPAGVQAIGAAVIGPTIKGPAFIPTVIRSFSEYERLFGSLSEKTFVPQTVREYLRNAGSVTVCRVLAGGGYNFTSTTSPAYIVAGKAGVGGSAIEEGFAVDAYLPASASLIATIFRSKNTSDTDLGQSRIESGSLLTGSLASGPFNIILSGSDSNPSATPISASFVPSRTDYLPNRLGFTPDNSKDSVNTFGGDPGYIYLNFKNLQQSMQNGTVASTPMVPYSGSAGYSLLGNDAIITVAKATSTHNYTGSAGEEGYQSAATPFITSQLLGEPVSNLPAEKTVKNLFKFHTLAHGTTCNTDYKVSVQNLREVNDIDGEEQYSTFSIIIRKYNDTDKNPIILETYNNLNLNPDSPNYIARRIGDRYPQYNDTLGKVEMLGNYSNISNLVRVEMDAAVDAKATSPKLMPKGFAPLTDPIPTSGGKLVNVQNFNIGSNLHLLFPSCSYEVTQSLGSSNVYSSKGYLGWKFQEKQSDNNNWIKPIPSTDAGTNIAGRFNVDSGFGHADSSLYTLSLSASIDVTGTNGPAPSQLKFSVPFQGGNDGIAPHTPIFTGAESSVHGNYSNGDNLYGFDLSETGKAGFKGYKKAIDILSNQDEYDINMLSLPGVIHQIHPLVTNAGIDMVEERGDAFFVMDLSVKDSSVNQAVNQVSGLDTNYAAVYYPWVKVLDTSINKPVFVPPSVIVPGAIAASDRIGAEWFAPAGLNRGILGNVLEAKIRLNQAERDVLYDNKINPIATFPQTGVCIWGQKTLQERPTALDRINVRRLLINLKKFIASSSRFLVFEQNTIDTRDRFLNIVNPYLETVQQQQGLFAFRVQMDESNNTPNVIDRNQLVGAIFLQPAKTAEFIVLDFNVLPTGATFDGGGSTGAGGGGGGGY